MEGGDESRVKKEKIELEKLKRDLQDLEKTLDNLLNIPTAIEALQAHPDVLLNFRSVLKLLNENFQYIDPKLREHLQRKNQELRRNIASIRQDFKGMKKRIKELEAPHSGNFLWKIDNYKERKRDAMNTNIKSIYSSPFYTSQYGYKLCGRVFLTGDGVGKGTHISLFLTIMKGPYDAVLPWPFRERITFQLVNQDDPTNKSIVEAFRPDPSSSSFKKPATEKNIGAGCPLFAKIHVIENPKSGFLRDNTIYFKIISQTSDIPEDK